MTKKEKRIAIVKDTLNQLKNMKVAQGSYIAGACNINNPKEDIIVLRKNCKVCALGGLFLSYIGLYNSVDKFDMVSSYDDSMIETERYNITDKLSKYFSDKQLNMIECAFEGGDVDCNLSYKEEEVCAAFTSKCKTPAGRLRKILTNILENDGLFKP